jgi:hypothetical protein
MSIALFTSLTFLKVGNTVADLQYRVFAIFIASVMPVSSPLCCIVTRVIELGYQAIIITQVEPSGSPSSFKGRQRR